MKNFDLIVFSHLRWEFVFQRPQHLISRFAKDRKVLFVEELIQFSETDKETANIITPSQNITVIQPKIPYESMSTDVIPIVKEQIKKNELQNTVLWFYAPMYSDVIGHIPHTLVIFDCMDELAAFKNAPAALIEKESFLLSKADIVFTGGKSLYESKKKKHHNVYCFPSSVDQKHFAKALSDETPVPEDIAAIKKPIVGYYGVIDERIDIPLLKGIAEMKKDISFVMIGPIVKIQESDLPKRDNIFYLGGKKYDELPQYLKAIDITMMPFALNESTKFISPTKTLEYMAAYKPIISTPIYDVVRDYKKQVSIVNTIEEFSEAIDHYLDESEEDKNIREKHQKEILNKTSWDNTYNEMLKIINLSLKTA